MQVFQSNVSGLLVSPDMELPVCSLPWPQDGLLTRILERNPTGADRAFQGEGLGNRAFDLGRHWFGTD